MRNANRMPIFETFYCPWKKKNKVRCTEGYKVIENEIKNITCRYWKKDIGCTYKGVGMKYKCPHCGRQYNKDWVPYFKENVEIYMRNDFKCLQCGNLIKKLDKL